MQEWEMRGNKEQEEINKEIERQKEIEKQKAKKEK